MIKSKLSKTALSVLLTLTFALLPAIAPETGLNLSASAATVSEMNRDSVFLKQHTAVTCTLASAAMAMRRTALAAGISDWEEITEENIKDDGWVSGVGLLWSFKSYSMQIGHGYFSESDNEEQLIELLESYPQGVVVYNSGNGGQDHAVFVTDYDEKTGVFYAADPSNAVSSGRIKFSETSIYGSGQDEKIGNLSAYWYVSSPLISLSGGIYSYKSGSSGSIGSGNGQSSYNPESDASVFNATKKAINKYYVVSDQSSDGVSMRYYPSGNSSEAKNVTKGEILFVTYGGSNDFGAYWYKASNGYYVYSDNLTEYGLYSAETVKFNNTCKNVNKTYAVASASDSKTALRIEPSEGNNIAAHVNNGTNLNITKSGVNTKGALWYLTSDGYYVKAYDMKLVSETVTSGAVFSGTAGTVTGFYKAEPVEDVSSSTVLSDSYKITASALNIRKSAVDGDVIGSVPQGEIVVVTSSVSGWGKITYNGVTGWISLAYAQKLASVSLSPLAIDSVSLSAESVYVGDSVKCGFAVTGGSGTYKYSYTVYDDKKNICVKNTALTSPSFVYVPEKAGNYFFELSASDSAGNTTARYSKSFSVINHLQINSVTCDADDCKYVGETITWTVDYICSSDSAEIYFSLYRDSSLVKTYESSLTDSFSYTPEESGNYSLSVTIKDEANSTAPFSGSEVTVYDALSISEIKLSSTVILKSGAVDCHVTASGGTGGFRYCFSVFKDGKNIISGAYSESNDYTYNITEPGKYMILCAVKDSGNNTVSALSAEIYCIDALSGDINGDGVVSSADARLAIRYSARLSELSDEQKYIADINGDGVINATDARRIIRRAAKLEA